MLRALFRRVHPPAIGRRACLALLAAALWQGPGLALAESRVVRLATAPAIEQSGLLAPLLVKFKQTHGVPVQVLAVPPANLLELARRGEADVLLVLDDPGPADKALQAVASRRTPVMRNEFVLVGPKADPAGARGKDLLEALRRIDASRSLFISRGDQGIVHAAEQRFWVQAGLKAGKGGGHRECRCGMGGVLDIAATAYGYALSDTATWGSFRNRGELAPLVEGDPRLVLSYSVLVVNADRRPRPKSSAAQAEEAQRVRDAQAFAQWLAEPAGQGAIGAHRMGGQPFFVPRAAQ